MQQTSEQTEAAGRQQQQQQERQSSGRQRTDGPEAAIEGAQEARPDMKKLEAVCAHERQAEQPFKVSPLRWRILLGICIFGLCNGISNESNPILNVYTGALDLSIADYVYLGQSFFFVPWVAGFSAAALVERGGVRLAAYLALLVASVRNAARALLFATEAPGWLQLRWIYWAVQHVFTALTVAQYYTLPLRVAESWFSESERALALNLMLAFPKLGSACAALVYPLHNADFKHAGFLVHANLIAASVGILFVSACVHRSRPREGAPNARNQINLAKLDERGRESLRQRLGKVLAHKQYLLHVFVFSIADPLHWTVQAISQDIFKSAGLSGVFCGQYLALNNIVGAFMQILCSYLWRAKSKRHARQARADQAARDKKSSGAGSAPPAPPAPPPRDPYRTLKCKSLLAVQCSLFVAFCYSLIIHELHSAPRLLQSQWWLVILTTVCYISVRSWAAPYYNEQAAELICGTIGEPTSGACQMFSCSLMVNVLSIIFVRLRQEQAAQAGPAAGAQAEPRAVYKWSVLFEMVVALASALLYVLKFEPDKRPRQDISVVRLEPGVEIVARRA